MSETEIDERELEARIVATGERLLAAVGRERPSLFDRKSLIGKTMAWAMENDDFRLRLFRFVDVFPALRTPESLVRHIREYFGDGDMPELLRWGVRRTERLGGIGAAILAKLVERNVREMARMFIAGETAEETAKSLGSLRGDGFAATIDILGEAVVSEEEAEEYLGAYSGLLAALAEASQGWRPLRRAEGGLDWGSSPMINVSVKPSSLFSRARPVDFEGSVRGILKRLVLLYEGVIAAEGFLCIDMETSDFREMTLEVYRRLRAAYPGYRHLGIAIQAYLRETDRDLEELAAWARGKGLPVSVRLVKGAYWDQEVLRARQNGWEVPVYTVKSETDAAFERHARFVLENSDICRLACGSHNIRSVAAVLETARTLRVPEERYEFQVLYGMAEPVRRAILAETGRVRLYAPVGDLVAGMGYLVRRLLENTANESFLRRTFGATAPQEPFLGDPRLASLQPVGEPPQFGPGELPPFRNEPAADFSRREVREAFAAALAEVRRDLGRSWPLFIDGRDLTAVEAAASVNPADQSEVVGRVCQAGTAEAETAVAAAVAAFPAWRETGVGARAELLLRGAEIARKRIFELAAWQVLEIGKQWDQAYADVTEAIDFLEYYAREAIRLGKPRRLGEAPGEENFLFYEPRGVAAVIAPWNFPLAISCGMASAALAAGNCVVYKPSGLTPVTGRMLAEILRDAGLPPGVFNFVPGRSGVIGDFLVDHPRVDIVAFTGSLEVGLRIAERAGRVVPGQRNLKRVVCEMGGKNAIIVDDDADLDEAVPQVLASAFGFQGEKCSACSRVIVLDPVYDRFVARLAAAMRERPVGPPEDPSPYLGPLAEEAAREKVLGYIELGMKEGKLLYLGSAPDVGFYVPPAIFGEIRPEHCLAREEIFGPVLSIMRAADFDEALEWANATRYALTGGLFSRSPARIERARSEFRVGNLYINRGITGALVGRQPFGGTAMSGGGTKAGGPDYLLHFLYPRVVTENTVRRGFAPESG